MGSLRPGELEREPCSDLRGQEDGRHGEQAHVQVSPWASPGHSAEEFRRRAGLSSHDLQRWARVIYHRLLRSLFLTEISWCIHACFRAVARVARRDAAMTVNASRC